MGDKFQFVAYASTGATIAIFLVVPLLRLLGKNWFEEQKAFKVNTLDALERLTKALGELDTNTRGKIVDLERKTESEVAAAIRTSEKLVQALRDEGAAARDVLRQHVDREDLIIRERNHRLAGKMGAIRNRVAVVNEGQKALTSSVNALTESVHALELVVAEKLTAKGSAA